MEVIYIVGKILCSGFAVYFALVAVLGLMSSDKEKNSRRDFKFAALIPARNEATCVENIVASLYGQNYPKELLDVFMIPNNCTDETAELALGAGAHVLEAPGYVKSKGAALDFAMRRLQDRYDAFAVFDADNEVDPDFIYHMNQTLGSGVKVAKSRILAKNRRSSWVAVCYDIHFCAANTLLNRARSRLGLSARVIGTGFAVTTDLIRSLGGFSKETITEDAEFFATCAEIGEKIGFCEKAVVYDEEPTEFGVSLMQRKRRVSGIMQVFSLKSSGLTKRMFSGKGRAGAADAVMQFLSCYVQALIPFMALLLFLISPDKFPAQALTVALKAYGSTLILSLIVQHMERRLMMSRNVIVGTLLYPLFAFSFIPLQTVSLFKKTLVWKGMKHTGIRMVSEDCGENGPRTLSERRLTI